MQLSTKLYKMYIFSSCSNKPVSFSKSVLPAELFLLLLCNAGCFCGPSAVFQQGEEVGVQLNAKEYEPQCSTLSGGQTQTVAITVFMNSKRKDCGTGSVIQLQAKLR